MASLRAHAVSFLLRNTFKRQLMRAEEIEDIRRIMGAGVYKVPGDVEIQPETVGGVPGEWVRLRGTEPAATLLYLHGGGYFACSPRTHRPATCAFARDGFNVFVPDYRLAPEHPFPAAIEDARSVKAALADGLGSTAGLAVAGDSAGGGLTLALMLAERDAGHDLPAAAALFSPWTDMTVSSPSVTANEGRCAMFTADGIRRGAEMYLNGADPQGPLASPVFADLARLPPMLVHVSEAECLRDDGVRVADLARQHGVEVTLRQWPVVPHVWQLFHPFIPEGRTSLAEAAAFLHQRLHAETGISTPVAADAR